MTVLGRIETWLATSYAEGFAQLAAGVDEAQVVALETTLQRPLPDAFHALLAWRSSPATKPPAILGDQHALYALLSIAEITALVKKLDRDLAAGKFDAPTFTTKHSWVAGWIPFAKHKTNLLVVDLVGSFHRAAGQVIRLEPKQSDRTIVAPDLDAFLAMYARDLEDGVYAVNKKRTAISIVAARRNPDHPEYPIRKRVERDARSLPPSPAALALLAIVKQRMSVSEVDAAIAAGADLNARDGQGLSPLHLATQLPSTAPAEALLRAGADVNSLDRSGATPLIHAVRQWHPQNSIPMIRVLLAAGADRTVVDHENKTAADHAAQKPDVLAALL